MPTPRKPTVPTTEAIDQFCAQFDDLFGRYEERQALRQYLIGLLLPREHNKTLVELASIVPGARRQALHHFLHDAPWDGEALNQRRLQLWQAHPFLGPHAAGVLIVDETGDPKRGPPHRAGGPAVSGEAGACGGRGGLGDQSVDRRHPAGRPWGSNPTDRRAGCRWAQKDPAFAHQAGVGLDADPGGAGGGHPLSPGGR